MAKAYDDHGYFSNSLAVEQRGRLLHTLDLAKNASRLKLLNQPAESLLFAADTPPRQLHVLKNTYFAPRH